MQHTNTENTNTLERLEGASSSILIISPMHRVKVEYCLDKEFNIFFFMKRLFVHLTFTYSLVMAYSPQANLASVSLDLQMQRNIWKCTEMIFQEKFQQKFGNTPLLKT